jgi:hypothetical protein
MQRLEVSGAVRPIYGSLGVKRLMNGFKFCEYARKSTPCGEGRLFALYLLINDLVATRS